MPSLIDAARSLAPELATQRTTHATAKQLSPLVVEALHATQLLGVLAPHELGGHEAAPVTYIDILEVLAAADPATAWCVMTCSTSTLLAPYFARETATALWAGHPTPFIAGIFAPMGKLSDAGTLTGRWSYASGSRHADVFIVGALHGKQHVVVALDPAQVTVVENWDTLGLGGTGSHDLVVEGAHIPPDRVTSVFERAPWSHGALYRVPLFGLLALGIAACALGIARTALDATARTLDDKASSAVLARVGELRATLASSRAYLREVATTAYARAEGSATPIDAATRGELRLAASFVAERCADVVRGAFHLGGGASARADSPLGAALRDIETLLTHRMVSARVVPAATRAILELGTPPPDL